MLEFFITFIVCAGWGWLFVLLSGDRELRAWSLFLGLSGVPVLVSFTWSLGVPLNWAMQSFGVVGLLGFLSLAKDAFRGLQGIYQILIHPVSFIVLGLMGVLWIAPYGYWGGHWDEFSYWLLMPKQMLLFNSILSPEFPDQNFMTYLPGLPLLQILPELIFNWGFSESAAYIPNLLYGLSIGSILFSIILKHYKNVVFVNKDIFFSSLYLSALLVVVVLIVLFSGFNGAQFTPVALIEPASYSSLFGLLALLYQRYRGQINLRAFAVFLSVALLGGYWLKQYYMLIPGLMFVIAGWFWWWSRGVEPGRTHKDMKVYLMAVIIFGLAFFFWKSQTAPYAEFYDTTRWMKEKGFWVATLDRIHLVPFFIYKLLQHFSKDIVIHIPAFIGIWFLFKDKISRPVGVIWLVNFMVYLLTLLWFYFYFYSDYEAGVLASFDRYVSYYSYPLRTLGLLVFVTHPRILKFGVARLQRSQKLWQCMDFIKNWGVRVWLCLGIFIALVSMIYLMLPELKKGPDRALQGIWHLKGWLQNHPQAQFLIIEQQGKGATLVRTRYYLMEEILSGASLASPSSFAFYQDDWTLHVSHDEFYQLVEQQDLIWVYQSDDWLHNALQGRLASDCPGDLTGIVLIPDKVSGKSLWCRPIENL